MAGYLDNMAATDMNRGCEFEKYMTKFTNLADKNTTLSITIDKQKKELTGLRRKNNSLKNKLSAAAEPGGGRNEQNSVEVSIPDFPGCGPSSR